MFEKNEEFMKGRIFWVELNRFDTKADKSTWLEMGEVLQREGFQVTLLTSYQEEPRQFPGYSMTIRYFPALSVSGLFRYTLQMRILGWLWFRVKRGDIVIIRPHALWSGAFLRLFRSALIHLDVRTMPVEVRGLKLRVDNVLSWIVPWRLLRWVPHSHSFITEPLMRAIEKDFSIRFEEYTLWSSGVNVDFFAAIPPPVAKGEGDPFTFLYHGSISRNRGIGSFIQALSLVRAGLRKRLQIVIIGYGPEVISLKLMVASLGLEGQVHFSGFVPYPEIPAAIAVGDCFICPLPDRLEWNVSSPLKVLEYLASCRPVILTPIPAHLDIARDLASVVWADGEGAEDLARAMEVAFDTYNELLAATSFSRQMVAERFSWSSQGIGLARYLGQQRHQLGMDARG
ncbi:MAG: glycosyltransferase [Magnetococcus sp. DMHC-6]